jgi:F0F1-type ATP synthase membrane subunit c/vacuolar-type H+-ATPase subunit K
LARLVIMGLIVFAAVCLAFGAVGVGIGIGMLAGIAVLLYLRRRRTWVELGQIPGSD